MAPYLNENIPVNIHVFGCLESTNKTAKEMAISGAGHGTVIIADSQTAGKGRYGRSFYSPPKHGIYMSILLHPARLCFSTPTLLTAFAAVSVCEAIEAVTDKTPLIKWVNDVFVDGKKVCGILTEAVADYESGNTQWIVAGIGINLSTPAFPDDLRHIAGSVLDAGTVPVTRNRLASEVINRFVGGCGGEREMLADYKRRLFMLGKPVMVAGVNESYEAVAVDIDGSGRLIVKKGNGETLSLSSGEITIRNA
jgi:BirA family biotin operon repressor/biotin-[acetyl-CoA-carboxylase] ligase